MTLPLKIVSAIFTGAVPGGESRDFGAKVQSIFDSGAAVMTMKDMAGAYDPAPFKKKSLTIEYSINGKVKKKTFGEGATVNFRQELK